MLPKIALCLSALGFLGFGVAALIAPVAMMAGVDLVLVDPRAIVEIRSFYGGLGISLGILLLLSLQAKYQTAGLILGCVSYLGIALARIFGMLMTATSSNFLWIALTTEIVFVLLCGLAWWRQRTRSVS